MVCVQQTEFSVLSPYGQSQNCIMSLVQPFWYQKRCPFLYRYTFYINNESGDFPDNKYDLYIILRCMYVYKSLYSRKHYLFIHLNVYLYVLSCVCPYIYRAGWKPKLVITKESEKSGIVTPQKYIYMVSKNLHNTTLISKSVW